MLFNRHRFGSKTINYKTTLNKMNKEIKLSKDGIKTFGLDFAKGKFFLEKWHRDTPSLIVISRMNQYGKKLKNREIYHRNYFVIK